MSFFSKPEVTPSATSSTPVQASFIDILYDHAHYLQQNDGVIARPSPFFEGKKVAVIGSGPAGLLAAYQLMQCGLDVTVFEADDRYGGRVYSYHPKDTDSAIFELGAMRVPPSEKIFNYYANSFGMQSSEFPDPGKVNTDIIFQGKRYNWQENQQPPEIFSTISASWQAFVSTLEPLAELLKEGTAISFSAALEKWQALINPEAGSDEISYSNVSFYQGLVHLFVDNYSRYGLQQPWGQKEFSLFGSLGLGSGGFGPLYQVNFAEIVRLIVNGLETDQRFYPCGLSRLVEGFADSETGYGKVKDHIVYNSKVSKIETHQTPAGQAVTLVVNQRERHTFDAVIVATTTRSMQVDLGLTLPQRQDGSVNPYPVLDAESGSGVRQLHLMNSSKLFVLTRTKFWNDKSLSKLPSNIQSDGLVRGLYCLDYPDSQYGVVLVSYTWGDDSTKYIAVKDANQRLELLMESLQTLAPDFIDVLKDEVMHEHTRLIDWQDEMNYYGAFKLNYPGQDSYNQHLYYQFTRSDNAVYLAGDSISWSGGWIEGALQTGMNAAAAVINQLSAASLYDNNPMSQRNQADQYRY